MAKLSSDKKYVTVEKGDTLSQIAKDYKSYSNNATYKQLAAINDIPNPDIISIGQKIYLTKSGSSSSSKTTSSNKVTIKQFGLQSNADNTLFVTWAWDKKNTDNYEVEWQYHTGDDVWFTAGKNTTEYKQSTYSIPSNAKKVRVRIKPISKSKTSNGKTTKWMCAPFSSTCKTALTTLSSSQATLNFSFTHFTVVSAHSSTLIFFQLF